MEISFTKEQYRALLHIVYLGEWLAHARKAEGDRREIREIEQHVYSFARQFGEGKLVEERDGKYLPARKLEESLAPVIREYDDDALWGELVEALAERDLLAEHGEEGVGRLSREKYDEQFSERAVVYEEEFREFGVDRLQIVED